MNMFNELKTTVMKNVMRYISLFLMVMGISIGQVKAEITLSGDLNKNIAFTDGGVEGTLNFELTNSSPGWTNSSGYGYINVSLSGDDADDNFYISSPSPATYKKNAQYGTDYIQVDYVINNPGVYTFNIDISQTTSLNAGDVLQSKSIPVTFTVTSSCTVVPTISSVEVTNVTQTSATYTCSGGITAVGAGCELTEYGFVASLTNTTPTIGGAECGYKKVGTSIAVGQSFSVSTTSLPCGSKVYVRAYARNGAGYGYSEVVDFNTDACRYDIEYDCDGADSNCPANEDQVLAGDYTMPSAPVKSGWHFDGWLDVASDVIYVAGATYNLQADAGFIAQWSRQLAKYQTHCGRYTVTYDGNGETGGVEPVDETIYTYDDYATILGANTLVREESMLTYRFKGWNTAANGSGTSYKEGDHMPMTGGNTTLYAIWSELCVVTYQNIDETEWYSTECGNEYECEVGTVINITTGTPQRDCQTFVGWFDAAEGGNQYAAGQAVTITSNTAIYAHWTPQTRTITYVTGAGDPIVYTPECGAAQLAPEIFAQCDDKTFMGWSEVEITELQQAAPTMVSGNIDEVTEDVTFYAVYASQNGHGETSETDVFTSYSSTSDYQNITPRTYGRWSVINGGVSGIKNVTDKMGKQAVVLQRNNNNVNASMTAYVKGFEGISAQIATTDNSVTYHICYSTNGGISWTDLLENTAHVGYRGKNLYGPYKLDAPVDALVRIELVGASNYTSKRVYVDDVTISSNPHGWFYTDYSTNCTKAASTTMSFSAGTGTGSVDAITTDGWITLPAETGMTKDCDLFAGWQVTGVDGYTETFQTGDKYLLNHDVTMTAQWTDNPCAIGSLDATAEYITSANGQAIKSIEHALAISTIDGETVNPVVSGTDAAMFAVTDGEIHKTEDVVTSYTFRIQYAPTASNATHTATLSFTDANGKTITDSEGADLMMTINGRSVADQIVLAAKVGAQWYALPANMEVANTHIGLPISVDNDVDPTTATAVSADALYTLHALDNSSTSDPSRVRFASTLEGHKALWGTNSATSISIKNFASIDGTSAKGDAYDWIISTSDLNSYSIQNYRAEDTRSLSLNSEHYWGLHANVKIASSDIRILTVGSTVTYIPMTIQSWQDQGYTFTTTAVIPTYTSIKVLYAGEEITATMTATSPYTITITGIDFDEHSGEALTVQWYNGESIVAMGVVNTPIFIKTDDASLDSYDPEFLATTDVHVLNGGKLTVASNCTIHNLIIDGGADVVQTAGTFAMNELSLKGGWTTSDKEAYDMPRLYLKSSAVFKTTQTIVNFDLTVDKSNYYPFAVPFAVPVNTIDYVDPVLSKASVYGKHFVIKTYDGAARAKNGEDKANNWVVVPSDATLQPGVGYIITAVTPAGYDPRIRIPMTIVNGWTANGELSEYNDVKRDTVHVVAHTGTKAVEHQRHAGWNFVANPYLSCFNGAQLENVNYVTIPVHNFSEYLQIEAKDATLRPEWGFFVQADKTGTMNFANAGRVDNDDESPVWVIRRGVESERQMKTALVLTHDSKSDKTGLIISNRYTLAYEVGADLEKMFGDGYTLATYTVIDGARLAFNAMSEYDAQQLIPVGFRAPESGEYTFSLDPQYDLKGIERLDLIDYETGELTNLLTGSYTFNSAKTQDDERFAINAVIRQIGTDIHDIGTNIDSGPQKIIYKEHFYIINHDDVFNGSGQRVK